MKPIEFMPWNRRLENEPDIPVETTQANVSSTVSTRHSYIVSDVTKTRRAAAISGSVQSYPSMAWFITAHRRIFSL